MRYAIAVDTSRGGNPDQEKISIQMMVAQLDNGQFRCDIFQNSNVPIHTLFRNTYEDAKQSGLEYIQDNFGDITSVTQIEFM